MKSKNTNNKDGRRGPVRNTIDFMKGHYKKGPWNSIVIAVAAVLVFITTYKLILPALSMSRPTYCGMEEHVHTEECYSDHPYMNHILPKIADIIFYRKLLG